jgi:hypothetical protein
MIQQCIPVKANKSSCRGTVCLQIISAKGAGAMADYISDPSHRQEKMATKRPEKAGKFIAHARIDSAVSLGDPREDFTRAALL